MRPEISIQQDPTPIMLPPAVPVLGVPLALTDYERTLDWIDSMAVARARGYVCVCNVHTVMASQEDPELRTALHNSSINVPDGQPLVWAINALGHQLGSVDPTHQRMAERVDRPHQRLAVGDVERGAGQRRSELGVLL